MTEREKIVERMADAILDSMDGEDLGFPRRHAEIMADAALRVIESDQPRHWQNKIKSCNCGHNGYGKHLSGCTILQ